MIGNVMVQIPGEPEPEKESKCHPLNIREYTSDDGNYGTFLYDRDGKKGHFAFIIYGSSPWDIIAFAEKIFKSAKADFGSKVVRL